LESVQISTRKTVKKCGMRQFRFFLGREAITRGDGGRGFVDIFSVTYTQV